MCTTVSNGSYGRLQLDRLHLERNFTNKQTNKHTQNGHALHDQLAETAPTV